MQKHTRTGAAAALVGVSLLVTACATGTAPGGAPTSGVTRDAAADGRVAVAYEGGIAVLEARTLEIVERFETEGFRRLSDFGDGRTIAVTTSAGFQMLDTVTPELTDAVFEADKPGHVVPHAGSTVLFDDGTGISTIVATDAFDEGYDVLPKGMRHAAEAAHHGVSIVLDDDVLLTTVGDETTRAGAAALHPHDDHWDVSVTNDQCPGIHGEGVAKEETVVFGCENGALMFSGGEFVKLDAPDAYGRMGNVYSTETSPIVVGDYKSDPDAEGYLLSAVTLIDTESRTLEVVELPDEVRYTFRDIARGPGDLAYILSSDGQIHVLDPRTGEFVDAHPVIDPWEGPAQWQDPHPAITVHGDIAYITEPSSRSVHAVDLESGEVISTIELDAAPAEIVVARG